MGILRDGLYGLDRGGLYTYSALNRRLTLSSHGVPNGDATLEGHRSKR